MEGLMYPVPFCDTEELEELAVTAETLEYDSIGGNDHVITQEYVKEEWDDPPKYYDVFTTMAYAAAVTSEITLNFAVAVLPMRNPAWVAKQSMTLDQLSDGRVILGTGIGSYREEFEALNPHVDMPRGKIMDESVEALSLLLDDEPAGYDGDFVRIGEMDLYPKPEQDPFPLYIGGNHENAIRRAAKWGQGWLPAALSPRELREGMAHLEQACQRHGRDRSEVDVGLQLNACIAETDEAAREKFKRSQLFAHVESLSEATLQDQSMEELIQENLIGSPESIIEKVQNYIDQGLSHFPAIIFAANDVEDLTHQMTMFADEIMPSFKQ